jgi:hypothetical protein
LACLAMRVHQPGRQAVELPGSEAGKGPFRVVCFSRSGARLNFSHHASREDAEAASERLRRAGCRAVVQEVRTRVAR